MRQRQFLIGVCFWTMGIIVAIVLCLRPEQLGFDVTAMTSGVSSWAVGAANKYPATSKTMVLLSPGDPIFFQLSDGSYRQIGHVSDHLDTKSSEAWVQEAEIVLYDRQIPGFSPAEYVLQYHTASTSLESVFQTLITPEKQKEIARLIAEDWGKHRDGVLEKLRPVLEASLTRAAISIEAKLPEVLAARRPEFAKLADRYQTEIVRNEIVPMVRRDIMPIVQDEIRPLARDLGQQLWDRVSLWSFTWRYLYDASPLPQKNRVQREFNRFLTEEVTPALDARTDEFVAVTQRIVSRVSQNERVRMVIRENLKRLASDPELQQIVLLVIQESVLQNEELHAGLGEYWEGDEVRELLEIASASFEPTARAVADTIIGNREQGITDEFSRVLRLQILMKDRRWLVLVPRQDITNDSAGESAANPASQASTELASLSASSTASSAVPQTTLEIVQASFAMEFPLSFESSLQSPLTPNLSPLPQETPDKAGVAK